MRMRSRKKKQPSNSQVIIQPQLQSRPFAEQSQTNSQPKDLSTQEERLQQPGFNFADIPIFAPNQAAHSPPIQPKLTIGQPNDKYEQEADAVAHQVVNQINAPQAKAVQRETAPEEKEESVQAKSETNSFFPSVNKLMFKLERDEMQSEDMSAGEPVSNNPIVQRFSNIVTGQASNNFESSLQSAKGGGQTIADGVRKPMEGAFGADFSKVKVHTDNQSNQLNQSIQAKAFTTGTDIFFKQGAYNPGTRGGQELIAHELTHVVQQNNDSIGTSASPLQKKPTEIIQRSLEYANLYYRDPNTAKAAIDLNETQYDQDQEQFENKLGYALYKDDNAKSGADVLLQKILALLAEVGLTDQAINEAFAVEPESAHNQIGAVLAEDVQEAMASGNLREKMGMIYQAIRGGKLAEAFKDKITGDSKAHQPMELGSSIAADKISQKLVDQEDELKDIEDPKDKYWKLNEILFERRHSIDNQDREDTSDDYFDNAPRMTAEELEQQGVSLSAREKKAIAASGEKMGWVRGEHFYLVQENLADEAYKKYARMLAGLSGSGDWYFHVARHLNLDYGQLVRLRLAALGQMLTNHDHSYHEIMHGALTQGGLTDYPDELPIGYTNLNPYPGEDLLSLPGMPEQYPGDKQAKLVLNNLNSDEKIQEPVEPPLPDLPTVRDFESKTGIKGKNPLHTQNYKGILKELRIFHTQVKGKASSKDLEDRLTIIYKNAEAWLGNYTGGTQRRSYKTIKTLYDTIDDYTDISLTYFDQLDAYDEHLKIESLGTRLIEKENAQTEAEQPIGNITLSGNKTLGESYQTTVIGENQPKIAEMKAFEESDVDKDNLYDPIHKQDGAKHARHAQFHAAWGRSPKQIKHREDFAEINPDMLNLDGGQTNPGLAKLTNVDKLVLHGWTQNELYELWNDV